MPYHHGDLESALLDAARAELEKHGPDGLSLRGVARRAGVSHAAPYHHFDGRADLLARLAEQGFRDLDAAMRSTQTQAKTEADEQLLATGMGYMRFALEDPAVFKLMFRGEYLEESDDEALREARTAAYGRLFEAIQAVHRAHHSSEADPFADTLVAWSSVHGLAMLAVEGALGWIDADFDTLAKMLAQRLLPLFR